MPATFNVQERETRSLLKHLIRIEKGLESGSHTCWSDYVFLGLAKLDATPKKVDAVLSMLDFNALSTIQRALTSYGAGRVSLKTFLKVVIVRAGAYDRDHVIEFIAGLVDIFNEIVPRGMNTISWSNFAEIVITTSSRITMDRAASQGTNLSVLSSGLAKACRAQIAMQQTSSIRNPEMRIVPQIPGGLLMSAKQIQPEFKREELDKKTDDPKQIHPIRRMHFLSPISVICRIEHESDAVVLYHPASNVTKIVRPQFEVGENDGVAKKQDIESRMDAAGGSQKATGSQSRIVVGGKSGAGGGNDAADALSGANIVGGAISAQVIALENALGDPLVEDITGGGSWDHVRRSQGGEDDDDMVHSQGGESQSLSAFGKKGRAAKSLFSHISTGGLPGALSKRDEAKEQAVKNEALLLKLGIRPGPNMSALEREYADPTFRKALVHQMSDQNMFHIVDAAYDPRSVTLTLLTTNKHVAQMQFQFRSVADQATQGLRGTQVIQRAEYRLTQHFNTIYFMKNTTYKKHMYMMLPNSSSAVKFFELKGETPANYPETLTKPLVVNTSAHKAKVTGYLELPNSSLFLTCGRDGMICLWDGRTLNLETRLDTESQTAYTCMDFILSTGMLLSCTAANSKISVWNMENNIFRGLKCQLVEHRHAVVSVCAYENSFFSLDEKSYCVMWDAKNLTAVQVFGGFPLIVKDIVLTTSSSLRLILVGNRPTYFSSNDEADHILFGEVDKNDAENGNEMEDHSGEKAKKLKTAMMLEDGGAEKKTDAELTNDGGAEPKAGARSALQKLASSTYVDGVQLLNPSDPTARTVSATVDDPNIFLNLDTDPPVFLSLNKRSGMLCSATTRQIATHSRVNPFLTKRLWSSPHGQPDEVISTGILYDSLVIIGTTKGALCFLKFRNGYQLRHYHGIKEMNERGVAEVNLNPPKFFGERHFLGYDAVESKKSLMSRYLVEKEMEETGSFEGNASKLSPTKKSMQQTSMSEREISTSPDKGQRLTIGKSNSVGSVHESHEQNIVQRQTSHMSAETPGKNGAPSCVDGENGGTNRSVSPMTRRKHCIRSPALEERTRPTEQNLLQLHGHVETTSPEPSKSPRRHGKESISTILPGDSSFIESMSSSVIRDLSTTLLHELEDDSPASTTKQRRASVSVISEGGMGNEKDSISITGAAGSTDKSSKKSLNQPAESSGLCQNVTSLMILYKKDGEVTEDMSLTQVVAAVSSGSLLNNDRKSEDKITKTANFFDAVERDGKDSGKAGVQKVNPSSDKLFAGSQEGSFFVFDLETLELIQSVTYVPRYLDPRNTFAMMQRTAVPGTGTTASSFHTATTVVQKPTTTSGFSKSLSVEDDIEPWNLVNKLPAIFPVSANLGSVDPKLQSMIHTTRLGSGVSAIKGRAATAVFSMDNLDDVVMCAHNDGCVRFFEYPSLAKIGEFYTDEYPVVVSVFDVTHYHTEKEKETEAKDVALAHSDGRSPIHSKNRSSKQGVAEVATVLMNQNSSERRGSTRTKSPAESKIVSPISPQKPGLVEQGDGDEEEHSSDNEEAVAAVPPPAETKGFTAYYYVFSISVQTIQKGRNGLGIANSSDKSECPSEIESNTLAREAHTRDGTDRNTTDAAGTDLGSDIHHPNGGLMSSGTEGSKASVAGSDGVPATRGNMLPNKGGSHREGKGSSDVEPEEGEEETIYFCKVYLVKRNVGNHKLDSVTLYAQFEADWLQSVSHAAKFSRERIQSIPLAKKHIPEQLVNDVDTNNGEVRGGDGEDSEDERQTSKRKKKVGFGVTKSRHIYAGQGNNMLVNQSKNAMSKAGQQMGGGAAGAYGDVNAGYRTELKLDGEEEDDDDEDEDPQSPKAKDKAWGVPAAGEAGANTQKGHQEGESDSDADNGGSWSDSSDDAIDPSFEALTELVDYAGVKTLSYIADKNGNIHCVDMLNAIAARENVLEKEREANKKQRGGTKFLWGMLRTSVGNTYNMEMTFRKFQLVELFSWKAHQVALTSMEVTESPPGLATMDRLHICKVWSTTGECYAQFQQGTLVPRNFSVAVWPPPQILAKNMYFIKEASKISERLGIQPSDHDPNQKYIDHMNKKRAAAIEADLHATTDATCRGSVGGDDHTFVTQEDYLTTSQPATTQEGFQIGSRKPSEGSQAGSRRPSKGSRRPSNEIVADIVGMDASADAAAAESGKEDPEAGKTKKRSIQGALAEKTPSKTTGDAEETGKTDEDETRKSPKSDVDFDDALKTLVANEAGLGGKQKRATATRLSGSSFAQLLEHRVFSGSGVCNKNQAAKMRLTGKTKSLSDLKSEIQQWNIMLNGIHPADRRGFAPMPKRLISEADHKLRKEFFGPRYGAAGARVEPRLLTEALKRTAQFKKVAEEVLHHETNKTKTAWTSSSSNRFIQ